MRERLAGYLRVLGPNVCGENAVLTSGQFHDVVLAGDVAYRFPRDEQAKRRLPAAVALLAAVSEAGLPTAVPVPLASSQLERPVGQCYAALTRVPGQPLGPVTSEEAEAAIETDLVRLLDRLAELGSSPAIAGLVPRIGSGHWPGFASQVRQVLYPLMSGPGRRRAEAELTAVTALPAEGSALVHSDLGGANLLWTVTPAGLPALAGVLDWDEAGIGDQASDLASVAVTFGWPLAQQIDARRQHSRRLVPDAQVIAATFALQQALPAALSGDQASLDDGLRNYR